MSERAGAKARVASDVSPAAGDNGAATLYIINLISSTTPMALEVPDAPELEGFAVFRSRRVEDGRDRFRLHVGYFESPEDAARVLPVVRVRYPAAWIALAPHDSMGSLDDTSVAEFKYIRQNRSANRAREKLPATKPVAVVATLVSAGSPNRPVQTRTPMTAAQVLQLLQSGPLAIARHTARPPRQGAVPAPLANAQKFAVQLVWSTKPVQARSVPQLAIFEAYTLYSVRVDRAGRRWYGLRLGFFKDPLSARQVALYARSDFSAAAVVPVSDRECEKAGAVAAVAQAAQFVPVTSEPARSRTDEIVLKEDKPTLVVVAKPVASIPVATPAAVRAPMPRATAPEIARIRAATPPRTLRRPTPKRRAAMTAAELLEELGANELGIDPNSDHDELSDSGVRHLSVAIVSRQSALARLLDRVSRKRDH